MQGLRYRDMVLNGTFSEQEMKIIVGIGNAIVRFLSQYIDADYAPFDDNERMQLHCLRDEFKSVHHNNFEAIQDLTAQLWQWMGASYFLVDIDHVSYFPYARWEAFWLMRGTTAIHAAYELQDKPF